MISGTQSVDLYSSTGLSLDLVCFHLGDISGQPVTFPKISGCQSEIQRLLWSPGCGSWCQWVGDHEGDAAMPLFLAMFSGNTVLLVCVHLFFHVFSHLKPAEIVHVSSFSSFSSVTRRCRPTGSWLRSTTLTRTLAGSGWKLLILFLACCFPPCPWRNDPHPLKMMPSSFGWYQFPSHLKLHWCWVPCLLNYLGPFEGSSRRRKSSNVSRKRTKPWLTPRRGRTMTSSVRT